MRESLVWKNEVRVHFLARLSSRGTPTVRGVCVWQELKIVAASEREQPGKVKVVLSTERKSETRQVRKT